MSKYLLKTKQADKTTKITKAKKPKKSIKQTKSPKQTNKKTQTPTISIDVDENNTLICLEMEKGR